MLSKAQIKTIHSLRHKKYRQKSGRFIAEGIKITEELLQGNHIRVESIFATAGWIEKNMSLQERNQGINLIPVTDHELKKISGLDTPQEVMAICELPVTNSIPILKGKVTLMLESVRDPGNVGTIIRIADWFGIEQVICSPDCADAFNPKTIQATMGSIARIKVPEFPLREIISANKTVPLFAATLDGQDITAFPPINEGILVIGNEANGLSREMTDAATHCIRIPRIGRAESLNAAVATGIICSRLMMYKII